MEKTNSRITPEMRIQLRKPFPQEAKKPIPGRTYLTTIKSIYVIERLNEVFGIDGWRCVHEVVSQSASEVVVRGSIILKDYDHSTPETYGGDKAQGSSKDLTDIYKGAVTNLIGKCASFLEIGIDVYKGNPGIHAQQTPAPAPKVQTPPKLETIPESSFNFELLEKMKWDKKYLNKGKDVIALTGKGGKKRVKITDSQKAVCELFLNRKPQTA